MTLRIKNPEVIRLAHSLANTTGENLIEAISIALRERLERETQKKLAHRRRDEIKRIQSRVSQLPRLDKRSDDEVVGYNELGLQN